ncbi:gamma-glutamyl-gamma-aminobutyrate hydrolase family protein [Streptomyces uncialis]|uniref:gamma-glutamyl-gamma-aminobutyrate hydrolase family protein n=1 Tax=Streptomyces uncialis TaxID=1048205 RepID=UPI00386EE7AC|nr:gamma-glutamyl-gamma-aminobutyrate hydrolase family protein [Streptomyces uncialis]
MRPRIAVIGRRAVSVSGLRFSGTIAAEAMGDAVFGAGGEPLILHGGPRGRLAELPGRLAGFDGVLLPGGADLGPARYGREPHPMTRPDHDEQDALDLAAARAVIALGVPALAVCRGMQVLNTVCGGTLLQHLDEDGPVPHVDAPHEVSVEPGSRLASVVGHRAFTVSSYHHQAVDRLGDALRVVAWASDSCVEAVEHTGADVLAVQWHPEDLFGTSRQDAALFGDLIERAAARRAATREEHPV